MELRKLLKMNLQHFAENEDTSTEETDTTETTDEEEQEETTFTRSDVDREVSKAVDKAIKKREAKHQEELNDAIQKALDEEKRLSKLSEKERQEDQLTQREKRVAQQEAEIARKKLKSDAVDDLQSKSLPSDFAEFLLGEDAESTLENINSFKTAFDEAVNAAVKEKLRQDTPKAGGLGGGTNKSKSLAEMAKNNRKIK